MNNQIFKPIYLLVLLLTIGALTFFSCQKDLQIEGNKPKVQIDLSLETRDIIDCDKVKEICPTGWIHTPTPGPADPILGIIVKDPTNQYLVEPIDSGEPEVKAFSVTTEEGTYVLSNTKDEFYRSFGDQTIEVPNCLYKFFELDQQVFTEEGIGNEELRTEFQSDVVRMDEETGQRIVEYTYVVDDCPPPPPTLIVKEWGCAWKKSRTANAIARHLLPDYFTPVDRYQWRNVIRNVVNDCAEEHGCTGCIDQACILENLEESMGKKLAQEMRVEHLALLIGLHNDNKDYLLDNPDLVNEMLGLYGIKSFDNCKGTCGGHAALNAFANISAQDHLFGISDIAKLQSDLCSTYTLIESTDPDLFEVLDHPNNSGNLGLHLTMADWGTLSEEEKEYIKVMLPKITNGFDEEEDEELNTLEGVAIISSEGATSCLPGLQRVSYSPNRGNIEDLIWGEPGDPFSNGEGVYHSLEFLGSDVYNSRDDDFYFEGGEVQQPSTAGPVMVASPGMRQLMEFFTNGDFEEVAAGYTDLFRNNTSATTPKTVLGVCNKVAEGNTFKNWFGEFVLVELNENIKDLSDPSDISGIQAFQSEKRIVFPKTSSNVLNGLTILINATEETNVYIWNYVFDKDSNTWTAEFCVEIFDHFGMDRNDLIGRQWMHAGFSKWWVLQHQRNYIPFEHAIYVNLEASGDLN